MKIQVIIKKKLTKIFMVASDHLSTLNCFIVQNLVLYKVDVLFFRFRSSSSRQASWIIQIFAEYQLLVSTLFNLMSSFT